MGAHHAGQRIGIGNGDRAGPKWLRTHHQLGWLRGTAQEGEIAGDLQFGVSRHGADLRQAMVRRRWKL